MSLVIKNLASETTKSRGGNFFEVMTPSGLRASAFRPSSSCLWMVGYPCGKIEDEEGSLLWTNQDVIDHLKSILHAALKADLKLFERRELDNVQSRTLGDILTQTGGPYCTKGEGRPCPIHVNGDCE